jgi:hypothetical protein
MLKLNIWKLDILRYLKSEGLYNYRGKQINPSAIQQYFLKTTEKCAVFFRHKGENSLSANVKRY